jgi:peptidoglycan biosynthesis protein MviN/MurJ (putative lipid II flippase)
MLTALKSKLLTLKDNPTILSVMLISSLVLGSKVLGFARTILLTKYDPIYADIFANGDKISGTVITIFLTGALASSVLPVASKVLTNKGDQELQRYFSVILALLIAFLFIICGLTFVFTPAILESINIDTWNKIKEAKAIDQYIWVSRLSILTCFNFGLQGLFGVILNLKKRFFIFSLTGIITNLGCIAGGLIGLKLFPNNVLPLVIGLIIGGIISTILYIIEVNKSGFKLSNSKKAPTDSYLERSERSFAVGLTNTTNEQPPTWITNLDNTTSSLKANYKSYRPELISTLQTILPRFFIIDGLLVASIAIFRIQNVSGQAIAFEMTTSIQAVFFIFVSSLGTIFFPNLSETLQNKALNKNVFWDQLTKYLKNAIGLGFAISVAAIFLSPVIVLIFEILGKKQAYYSDVIYLVQIGAFALFFQSVREILSKYMFTKEKVFMPVILSLSAMAAQVVYIYGLNSFTELDKNVIVITSLMINYMVWSLLGMAVVRRDYRNLTQE